MVARESRIHPANRAVPGRCLLVEYPLPRFLRMSAHFIAKYAAYSGRSNSRLIRRVRRSGRRSASKARTSATVGNVPQMSSDSRRINVASSTSSDGRTPSRAQPSTKKRSTGEASFGKATGSVAFPKGTVPW